MKLSRLWCRIFGHTYEFRGFTAPYGTKGRKARYVCYTCGNLKYENAELG